MRRLLVVAAFVAAAFPFAAPASAEPDCQSEAYGVRAGDFQAGVCAGGYCSDLCFIELKPYCEGAPVALKVCS